MTSIRGAVAAVAAVLIAACTSTSSTGSPDRSASGEAAAGDGLLPVAWESELRPVEPPVAVTEGFVFHGLSPDREFEVASVAAADGRVRWRAPASPSRVDHGVGLHVDTVRDGRTVVWMEPGRSYPEGDVSLVAADTVTGQRRWSYGAGRLRVRSAPSVCRDGAAVCLIAYRGGSDKPRAVVLDALSGRVAVTVVFGPTGTAVTGSTATGPRQLGLITLCYWWPNRRVGSTSDLRQSRTSHATCGR